MTSRLYSFGPFQLNTSEQVLLKEGRSLPLKPKVFDVLAVLVQNSGRVVSKDALMKQVWSDSFVEEGNLAVCVFEIRKALGANKNGHRYVETVPRRGYRFVATVTRLSQESQDQDERQLAISSAHSGAHSQASKRSIAVLPFKLIGEASDEYLGVGMADALITRLSNLRQVTVRPTLVCFGALSESLAAQEVYRKAERAILSAL